MRTIKLTSLLLGLLVPLAPAAGCRGWTSDQPPVHLNPNMDTQPKVKPYRGADFFADGAGMRQPPEGTVARTLTGKAARDADYLELDDHYYRAVVNGQVVDTPPAGLVVDEQLLKRGQDRYNIYCSPCHARHGTGTGLVASRLAIKPPTFHDELRYKRPLGHFYRAILHGVPLPEARATPDAAINMPSYAKQVPPEDRWAIALYIRAMQRVSNGGALPAAEPMSVSTAGATATPTASPDQPTAETPAPSEPSEASDPTPSPPTPAEGAEVEQ